MMIINNNYEIGEMVYLVTDPDQNRRVVTAILVTPDNSIMYELSQGAGSSKHYDFEISKEKDLTNVLS